MDWFSDNVWIKNWIFGWIKWWTNWWKENDECVINQHDVVELNVMLRTW